MPFFTHYEEMILKTEKTSGKILKRISKYGHWARRPYYGSKMEN